MNYLHPERLWWLLAVAAFAAVYIALQFSRPKYALRFTNLDLLDKVAPSRPDWRRYVPAIGFLTMAALLVFAWPTRPLKKRCRATSRSSCSPSTCRSR